MVQAVPLGPAPTERKRRPRALVILDPEDGGVEIDWSPWYLTEEEDDAHAPDHNEAAAVFASALRELVRERAWRRVRVDMDEGFAWVREQPLVRVSPDVFLMPEPPRPFPRIWQTWLPDNPTPRFALEIVSEDWKKDYEDNPQKYWQLGVRELVIFDPQAEHRKARGVERRLLQVFRRDAEGALVRVYTGKGPVRSEELDAWLVVWTGPSISSLLFNEGEPSQVPMLRLARDAEGKDLVPLGEESLLAAEQKVNAAEQKADAAEQKADAAEQKAGAAEQKAEEARRRAEQLAAKLRALGIEPDEG